MLKLSVPVIKGYRSALDYVFTLVSTNLVANRIISKIFRNMSTDGGQTTGMEPVSGSKKSHSSIIRAYEVVRE